MPWQTLEDELHEKEEAFYKERDKSDKVCQETVGDYQKCFAALASISSFFFPAVEY